MTTITAYQCDICHQTFNDPEEAINCEAQGLPPQCAQVGDVVICRGGYRWFNGKRHWLSNPDVKLGSHKAHGNCFGACCSYEPYYVVTAIQIDGHRRRYSLVTLALLGAGGAGYNGYTHDDNSHHRPVKVSGFPPEVLSDAHALGLLGQVAKDLI